jgi:K(+)-stimulated pyrophosphate-energized sodium pump
MQVFLLPNKFIYELIIQNEIQICWERGTPMKLNQKLPRSLRFTGLILIILALIGLMIPLSTTSGLTTAADIEVKYYKDDILLEEPIDGDKATIKLINHGEDDIEVNINITIDGIVILDENRTVKEGEEITVIKDLEVREGQEIQANIDNLLLSEITVKKPEAESPLIIVIVIGCVIGLGFAGLLARFVLKQDTGTKKMRKISDAIKEGAEAFLSRQYKAIFSIAVVIAILFAVLLGVFVNWDLGIKTAGAFFLGAICSGVAGYIGMYVSIRANIRTASASRKDLNAAMKIALWGGAVSGFAVVALSLLGVAGIYYLYGLGQDPRHTPLLIVGFGFGASLVALFAQLGGGIYTKAADVGADLVGKVEAGIPEDDPRNAAVIADLVGDNVGDCAGRGADLFESTAAENIGAMILGIALYPLFGINGIMFPLVARAFGLFATVAGIMIVRVRGNEDPMKALNRGYYLTCVLASLFFGVASYYMLGAETWWIFWICGIIGIIVSIAFVFITQYYTEDKYRPVKEIAKASETGPATNIISGFAIGMETVAIPIVVISVALLAAYELGAHAAGLLEISAWHGGLYGTAIATMGMLSTCAYILALDTFGPITDNASGINEMSGDSSEEAQRITAKLDAVGNTTKALTKGYAVGSAALAAFLLFSAYMTDAHLTMIDLSKPVVFIGAMIGAMLVFLFSAYAIRAVGRAAADIITEVRRQFREMPGIMKGTQTPDYARCVDITTKAALREMVLPGVVAIATPVLVGIFLRAEALGATLMVGTIAGVILALVLNNSGGAWDNAKKYIEEGNLGGKGSEAHKASVVGDTVGDPFKDTAGPSLHILVKLLSTITLVMAPLFI